MQHFDGGGLELEALDRGVAFKLVCNSHRRAWVCVCGTAWNTGHCAHIAAANAWLRGQSAVT